MRLLNKFCKKYDKIFTEMHIDQVKNFSVIVAIFSFLIHIFLVFLNNHTSGLPDFIYKAGDNYFSTIFTPFSIVLFYEVFLLITAIPKSLTRSLAKQFEVISLIIILRVFKDVSGLESLVINDNDEVLRQILADMAASLGLFILMTLFFVTLRQRLSSNYIPNTDERKKIFIQIKKVITVILSFIVAFAFIITMGDWFMNIFNGGNQSFFDLQQYFFEQLFTVLIFIDITIVLLSYAFTKDFAVIFRNAGFIVSTILIRFSITSNRPYDLGLAIAALSFGVLINFIFNLYNQNRGVFIEESVKIATKKD